MTVAKKAAPAKKAAAKKPAAPKAAPKIGPDKEANAAAATATKSVKAQQGR